MIKRCISTLGIGAVAVTLSYVDSYAMEKGIITASTLNVRSEPSTNGSIIGKINKDKYVDILEKVNGWYKLKLSNGSIGWSSAKYISIQIDFNSQDAESTGKKCKIISSVLNIRSGSGTNHSIISKANKGVVLDILKKSSNGWYKVKLPSGVIGWASSSYLVEVSNTSSNDTPLEEKPSTPQNQGNVVSYAYSLLGTPYKWGASGPNSFDCSGFTQYVYKQIGRKNIPRVSKEQSQYGQEVSKENLAPGDLVYFDTDKDGTVNHVGIYIGNNEFIHCSGTPNNPDKVKISNLATEYWSGVFKGIRRF